MASSEKTYRGRWINVTCKVLAVGQGDECYDVLGITDDERPIHLTFALAWLPDVEPLRAGHRISVRGQIRSCDAALELVYPRITAHWRPRPL
jgi:hypothetical protein